jgi:hypothetical protein
VSKDTHHTRTADQPEPELPAATEPPAAGDVVSEDQRTMKEMT